MVGRQGSEESGEQSGAARWSEEGLTAVVISGAGARGAYEAGALATLLPLLFPQGLGSVVLLGSSAGAINAVQWAQRAAPGRPLAEIGEEVCKFWEELDVDHVYRPLMVTAARRALTFDWIGRVDGLLDTGPSHKLAKQTLRASALASNLAQGGIGGVGVVATTCPLDGSGGRSRVFYQGGRLRAPAPDDTSALDYVATPLTPEHVLASAAIPGIFPAVQVTTPTEAAGWHCDGGLRMNTPIEPALRFGARRLVVVSSHATTYPAPAPLPKDKPDVVDMTAQSLHTALADGMVEDLRRLRKTNDLVLQARERGVTLMNNGVHPAEPYQLIPLVEAAPRPGVIARLARQVLAGRLPLSPAKLYRRLEFQLLRRGYAGLGSGVGNDELLSYLLFDKEFARRQIRIGRADGRAAYDELRARGLIPTSSLRATVDKPLVPSAE
ncbi:MAG: patatin-like phospholipase family protein [Polyangiales bacterium]